MVLVLVIVKASLKILGIGIGVKKVVLLMSAVNARWQETAAAALAHPLKEKQKSKLCHP